VGRTHQPRRALSLDELAALMRLAQTTTTTDDDEETEQDDDRD
jgi:hypothetical protein